MAAVAEQDSPILADTTVDSDNTSAGFKIDDRTETWPDDALFIDIDAFEYEDIPSPKQPLAVAACEGYKITFPEGKSPHTTYPFALHDTIILPWDYSLKNGTMRLFARNCSGSSGPPGSTCRPCQQLVKNERLENILRRMEGAHENTGFAYHGFGSLREMLQRKNRSIEFYRLRGLNQARKLLAKATALSDQKRLLMAIASGRASRVDRLISIGLRQKKGPRGLVASYMAAAEGYYNPKSFTEEEDMKALLLWKLGGNRVAEINHRANNAPSVSYLRTRSTVPQIVPSHEHPTVDQIYANVEATLDGVLEVIHSQSRSKWVHTVLMFDELATEKRIRWDPKTNRFLGICREHAHFTATEFINEGDMEELFQKLDDGKVHHAGEVRTQFAPAGAFVPFLVLIHFRRQLVHWAFCAKIIAYTLVVQSLYQETASESRERNTRKSYEQFSMVSMHCKTKQNSASFLLHPMAKHDEEHHSSFSPLNPSCPKTHLSTRFSVPSNI